MLRSLLLISMLIILTVIAGCDNNNDSVLDPRPEPPQGVFSVTGDGYVDIWWAGPYDRDIKEYIIYANSVGLNADYVEIDRLTADDNPNLDLIYYDYTHSGINNGTTYYYAVASVDHAGQISTLSAEDVFDTPRPEGVLYLYDIADNQASAGINFADQDRVDAASSDCDAYVDSDAYGVYYLNAGDINYFRSTKIQGKGYTAYWYDIDDAPTTGWSDLGYVEIIINHTYIIKTDDNHYAKMRVLNTDGTGVQFQWAYQTALNNPELIAPPKSNDQTLSSVYSIKNKSTNDLK